MPKPWSREEVELVVEDYFQMLKLELQGKKYNKTDYRRLLMNRHNLRFHKAQNCLWTNQSI